MDDMNSKQTTATAPTPSPAQPKKERRHPRRHRRDERSQAKGGRTLVEAPPNGTPEEQAKAVEAKLAQPKPVLRERRVAPAQPPKSPAERRLEAEAAFNELFDREGTLCLEQKPDRPDSSHICSVPSCKRWAGFYGSNNRWETAAVILLADGQARPVCKHHFQAALYGLRQRKAARDAGDEKMAKAYPRMRVFGSLASAKDFLDRKAHEHSEPRTRPEQPAGPKPQPRAPRPASATPPDSAKLEAKDKRRDARHLLVEILPPHLTGISSEQIAHTLSQSAEASDAAWETFTFCLSDAIAKLDDGKSAQAKAALALLEAHRKEVRARS